MTTYLALALWFLTAAAVGGGLSMLLGRRRPRPAPLAVTALVLCALTAAFDSLMIASGLFHYAPEHLLGITVGLAPLEDFAYPLAGVLLLPALWAALRARRGHIGGTGDEEPR